jgi:tetratricopeptide (TPR) repeat protein
MLAAPIPAALAFVARRPRTRRVPAASERLRRIARGGGALLAAGDVGTLRRTYAAALAERIGVAAAELADRRALVRALRRSGVTAEVASRADTLLGELDTAVYSGNASDVPNGATRAWEVVQDVDHEARPRIVPRGSSRSIGIVALLAASLAGSSGAQSPAHEVFDRGVREYEAKRYARAERFFGEAARLEPLSADAWANFGTAAWAARDTAAAAIGWQRALRLDPLASDVRPRLDLTPGFGGIDLTNVPPVSETTVAVVGGLAWVAAWLLAAAAIWRRRTTWRYGAYGLGIVAIASGIVGVRVREARNAKRLGVVVEASRLRSLPALGSEPASPVLTGEVARTVREEGVWSLIRTGDGREGWVETDRLEPIARPWATGPR